VVLELQVFHDLLQLTKSEVKAGLLRLKIRAHSCNSCLALAVRIQTRMQPSAFRSCFANREPVQSFTMIAKRVIPCLDVHDGQVTRGVQFGKAEAGELRNVGDPVALALRYNEQGADEMVFFDITASAHGRKTMWT
jgi:hypothetical protein